MWQIISNIAAIISILSAIVSVYQAYKAKQQRTETEKVKDFVIEKFTVYIESKLLSEIHSIQEELNKNRKKPFTNNPLMISQKLYNSVSLLLLNIRSQKIYEEPDIKEAITKSEEIIKNLNEKDFSDQISDLLGCLSDIARHIDISQRRT